MGLERIGHLLSGSLALELLFFISGMTLCMAQGNIHYYEFVLKESNFTRLCQTKSIFTVNGSFPGPVIRVHKGDTVFVNVHNHGYYGATIHWHGVKQPRNPWSDGPEFITQCPIEPGTNFTYEVTFTTEEGTLWWHAHSEWTRATVHGAIVVSPAAGTVYPFPKPDGEEVIVLASWYKMDLRQMVEQAIETGEDTPRSDAYTFNGQPGDLCPCSNETTYRILVDYGKTYLLRIVNAGMNGDFFFSIANHTLTLVGLDAAYVKPVISTYLVISPGQTMDVLVTANQTLGHYYMAARKYDNTKPSIIYFDHTNVTAILQYRGNYTPPTSPLFPSSTLPSYKDFLAAANFTTRFRSLASFEHPTNVPQNATTRMFIVVSMGQYLSHSSSKIASSANNISWVNPSIDVLMAYYRNISGVYEADFPNDPPSSYNYTGQGLPDNTSFTVKGTEVKVLEYNETVEIVFQGTNVLDAAEAHPMHLHGYSFYVIGTGIGNFDQETDPKGYNLVDPPLVNTLAVPQDGWATIRFIANNPGVWFMHCHYDRHLTWGMDFVFIVKNGDTIARSMRHPPAYMPPCTASTADHSLKLFDFSDEKLNTFSRT